ncbi:hypothetical protein [Spirosoma agri]|uniref:Uncharacterized protein n=1 Tax=Spirosoma agri TaxID=1987381 RepID=A0A6M0IIW1_9BACT|nr:hypothetical protein [Spirosoma agri]NEU67772.1 hypothetical protein [Spirosoma agri]
MNTEQNYSDRENYAKKSGQMGQNAPQILQMPDSRQPVFPALSEDLYSAQVGVLRVVDDYLDSNLPIKPINRILYHWLTTYQRDLSATSNQNTLYDLLGLVDFLTDLQSAHEALQFLIDFQQRGGQGHE